MSNSIQWDEDQQRVLADKYYEGIVFIDSVPGCGKTTVLTEAARDMHEGNTLIISLTNSVREGTSKMVREMLRRAKEGYTHKMVGNHNVFTRKVSKPSGSIRKNSSEFPSLFSHIHIATLDSWVHESLTELEGLENVVTDDYTGKRKRLLQYLQDGKVPDDSFLAYRQIAVDEVQDLDDYFFQILLELAKYCDKDRRMLLIGDRYQNVFAKGDACIMERIEIAAQGGSLPKYRSYPLRYNHRCPPAHLKFINKVFQNHGRKILWPEGKPDGELPIVYQLPKGKSKTILEKQAMCIMNLIEKCILDGYSLSDLVLLSPITSVNRLYGQLELFLKRKYGWAGHQKVAWLYNDATGSSDGSVDWKSARGKIVLSSIHANKGRTHKVVIACDFTDGILPKHHALRDIQIKAQISQALVALSRATERLIVPYAPPLTRFVAAGFATIQDMAQYCNYSTYNKSILFEPLWKDDEYKPIEKTRAPSTVVQLAKEMISHPFDLDVDEPIYFGPPNIEEGREDDVIPESESDPDDSDSDWEPDEEDCDGDAAMDVPPMETPEPFPTREKRPRTCTSSMLPSIMHTEHLAPVFGYFGQITLFNMLGLGLPARLTSYLHPIVTSSYVVAKKFAWEREPWLVNIHDNPEEPMIDYWNQIVIEQRLPVTASGSNNAFHWNYIDEQEGYKVGSEIVLRGGPEYCVVMHDMVARQPVIKQIQKEIREYMQMDIGNVPVMTFWNLAVAMCGLHNGIFEVRPWLRTLINHPLMDLKDKAFTALLENSKRIASIFRGRIKDSEFTVRCTIDGFPIQGRLDLCLDNGTIVDVKCPTTKEPKVTLRDWNQLALYVGLLYKNGHSSSGQLIVLDLSHGVYNKAQIKTSFDDLLMQSAKILKEKGYQSPCSQ